MSTVEEPVTTGEEGARMTGGSAPAFRLADVHPHEAAEVYDDRYAEGYDELWWNSDLWAADGDHYLDLLARWLDPQTRWLDVGCGTGWMLRHFPEVRHRAGVDLSASVLEQARTHCPGVEFRQGDALEPYEAWNDQWDLVTCTGQPWSYLKSLDEFDTWVGNLARWTSPTGVCVNHVFDILELTGHAIPYHFPPERPPMGQASVLAVYWSLEDPLADHGPMILPSLDLWVRLFSQYFTRVEVVHADPELGLRFPRAIVATGKREPGDERIEVVYDPPIAHPADSSLEEQRAANLDAERRAAEAAEEERRRREAWEEENRLAWEANEKAWAENQRKWEKNAADWEEHQEYARRETERANAAEAELARLSQVAGPSLATVPASSLAKTLMGRIRPRRVLRRLRKR